MAHRIWALALPIFVHIFNIGPMGVLVAACRPAKNADDALFRDIALFGDLALLGDLALFGDVALFGHLVEFSIRQ